MMKMERLTDFNAGSHKNWIWNGFSPNCDDLGGDVDGGSDGDEFLGVQLMTMYKYAVKIDAQYEKYDGCQFEGWDAFSAAHTMVNLTHNFELVGDYFYQGGSV